MFFLILNTWKFLSWENCHINIFRIRKRIVKSLLVGDNKTALKLQKLLIKSNSARLLSIRSVTQVSLKKKISGIDGKLSLTFAERLSLNDFLFYTALNWKPQKLKKVTFNLEAGGSIIYDVPTISDRIWHTLVGFAIFSANQYIFSSKSFSMSEVYSIHELQRLLLLNLNSLSFGIQKRVLIVEFKQTYTKFDIDKLLTKMIAPRGIKIGIFRSIKLGLKPAFFEKSDSVNFFSIFLADILFCGIESFHRSFRCGPFFLLLLKPLDNEKVIIKNIKNYLLQFGIRDSIVKICIHSPFIGFDFLNWHFKLCINGFLICVPSLSNYRLFLRRIKFIINNSNYGAKIKAIKISPIIRDWKFYNRYCNSKNSRVSLFFVQKQAFKVFNKESKQDFYSVKKLLQKSFTSKVPLTRSAELDFSYFGHIFLNGEFLSKIVKIKYLKGYFCIHCGMNSL